MLQNKETMIVELLSMKDYRKDKLRKLNYLINISKDKDELKKSKIDMTFCNFNDWMRKDNREISFGTFLDKEFLKELNVLHESWFLEYSAVLQFYAKDVGFIKSLFSNKINLEEERAKSYYDDLKITHKQCDEKVDILIKKMKSQ